MRSIRLIVLILLTSLAATCQNGPTLPGPPSVTLTWTQSIAPGISKNCVYRGATAGVYVLPALFCSTVPITTWTDTSVNRGSTYHYAITASFGSALESAYSNDVVVVMPVVPAGTPGPTAAAATQR